MPPLKPNSNTERQQNAPTKSEAEKAELMKAVEAGDPEAMQSVKESSPCSVNAIVADSKNQGSQRSRPELHQTDGRKRAYKRKSSWPSVSVSGDRRKEKGD